MIYIFFLSFFFNNVPCFNKLGDLFLAVNSNAKLFSTLKDYDNILSKITQQQISLADEIDACKDTYFGIVRMNAGI